MQIRGVIQSGLGEGAFFAGLDWVVDQFERAMGFKPFPGTLNVRVFESDIPALKTFFSEKDFELVSDNPSFCSARLRKVRINGIPAAAVFPSEDVRAHGREIIELMAEKHLKDALGLKDGDQVSITEFETI